ncbi:cytochrome-c peroxidase [Hyalangium minutum]|uniref:Cytochrome c551 peroxidase n=1 Tax=Hyalangium minutum TaxID=394096 RepID=A0A085W8P5_9BACT|nr:Cytochrome c551 peroxidase [Hyalangium minutum]
MKAPSRLQHCLGRAIALWGVLGALALRAMASSPEPVKAPPPQPEPLPYEKLVAPFQPPPAVSSAPAPEDTEARIALGRLLFFDARLSKNHDVSCNTCHDLATNGADHQPLSQGHQKRKGRRNSPTVYNVGGYIAQFWDGRAPTLEVQAEGPLFDEDEMAMPDDRRVLATLTSMPEYVKRFQAAFPGEKKPVTLSNLTRSLAAFQRQLTTRSRFDRFLAGQREALTEQERRGLELFVTAGCVTCHNGPAVGGTSLQKLGLVEAFPKIADLGRYEVTREEEDRMKFRVPTLRNVEKTAPYLHDGSVAQLDEMVRVMARYQLGKTLSPEQVESLVAFLRSLTGELPARYAAPPELPKSTRKTPKPDPT